MFVQWHGTVPHPFKRKILSSVTPFHELVCFYDLKILEKMDLSTLCSSYFIHITVCNKIYGSGPFYVLEERGLKLI